MRAQFASGNLTALQRVKLLQELMQVSSGWAGTEGPAGRAAGWRAPCPWRGSRGPGTSGGMQSCRQRLGASAAPLSSHRLMSGLWRTTELRPRNC